MTWVKTDSGALLNLLHCDLIEVKKATKGDGFELLALNAYQPIDPHVLRRFDKEADAKAALAKLHKTLGDKVSV